MAPMARPWRSRSWSTPRRQPSMTTWRTRDAWPSPASATRRSPAPRYCRYSSSERSGGELGGRGIQSGLDRRDELAGRGRGELDRDTRRGPTGGVGEVDVERVLGHRVHWVIEVDRAAGETKPVAVGALRTALQRGLH